MGEIRWDRIKAWLKQYGSPLYTYDLGALERRARELIAALPEESRLFFSLKANPLPTIAATLRGSGCRAEVSSEGELAAALEAGFPAPQLLYTGPGKSCGEIGAALDAGVDCFSVESFAELGRVGEVSAERGRNARVLLRVNPASPPKAKLSMSGVSSQFGIDEHEALEGAARLRRAPAGVEICGIHIYYGTQIHSVEALIESTRSAVAAAEGLSEQLGAPLRVLDLGGGFPWPYATGGAGPDLSPLRPALRRVLAERRHTSSAELWFESGRYLCASSGKLWATVMDVKRSKQSQFVVLDTGVHHLGGMSGLNRLPQLAVGLAHPADREPGPLEEVTVVGPLCTPLDTLARRVKLPPLRAGDVVCIHNVGAYGLTASLIGFLSRPAPVELTHRGEEVVDASRLRAAHHSIGDPA